MRQKCSPKHPAFSGILFIAIFTEVPRMSVLRKIEAKLGTAIITCIYLLSRAFVFTEPHFRIGYGKYPVGGKSPFTAGIGRLICRYFIC